MNKMKGRLQLHSCSAYQGFQAPQNCLEGGVEPLVATALLDHAVGPGEELDPDSTDPAVALTATAPGPAVFITARCTAALDMASSSAFVIVALSAVTFSTVALSVATFSTMALFVVALSTTTFSDVTLSTTTFTATTSSIVPISTAFSTAAAAAKTTLTVEVDPLPPDPLSAIDATIGSDYGMVAALGAYCPNNGGPLIVDPPP
jgi:hypothetical protein